MGVPRLVDQIHFDDGISAVATTPAGDRIAVGTVGMVGLYEVNEPNEVELDGGSLTHIGSFAIQNYEVTDLAFSTDGKLLYVKSSDCLRRTLTLEKRAEGMLVELRSEAVTAEEPAYPQHTL